MKAPFANRLLRRVDRLPLTADVRRAVSESIADACYERSTMSGLFAIARAAAAALGAFLGQGNPMKSVSHDIRYAMRRLRASPGYAIFSILTLGIAIGSSTAIYALVDSMVSPRQPIRASERMMNVYQVDPRIGFRAEISWPDYQDLAREQHSFSSMFAWRRVPSALSGAKDAALLSGEAVTGNYFTVFDTPPLLGRTLIASDDAADASPVLVLAEPTWRRLYGADPAVVGSTMNLGGVVFEVVGVMPSAFHGVDMPSVSPTPFWMPEVAARRLPGLSSWGFGEGADARDSRQWFVKGRLKDGVTVAQASSEVRAIAARLDETAPIGQSLSPRARMPGNTSRPWAVVPMNDIYLHESMHRLVVPIVAVLLGAVVLVLLVACSNIANLTLARASGRSHEIAIRLALGASRMRLFREQAVEGICIAACGWGVGLLLTYALLPILSASTDINGSVSLTISLHPVVNPHVLGASFAAALLAVGVAALGPAMKHSRADVRTALVNDAAPTSSSRWRTRGALITAQVTVSTMLLILTFVCVGQIGAVSRIAPGFDLDKLAIAAYDFGFEQDGSERAKHDMAILADVTRRMPAVESASLTTGLPFGLTNPGAQVFSLDKPYVKNTYYGHSAALLISTPDVFKTLGVPLVAGKTFADVDEGGEKLAVVSERLAREVFGTSGQQVIGRLFQYKHRQWLGDAEHPVWTLRVVGVAADTDVGSLGDRSTGTLYLPIAQHDETRWDVVARVRGDAAPVVAAIRNAMRGINAHTPARVAGTGMSLAGPEVLVYKIAATIAGVLGAFALVLAAVGLFGVISDLVSRRTREIGIRLALGADRRTVMSMVMWQGLRPVAVGLALGLGAATLARLSSQPLFVRLLPAVNPFYVALGLAPLLAASIMACYFPARRAARVQTTVALREQ